jgi:hypothetical protein
MISDKQNDTLTCLFHNFPKNKYYYVDENNLIGIREKGSFKWYKWDEIYEGYVWVGETNTHQGADKKKIPGR